MLSRREAREEAFRLLFETEFHEGIDCRTVYDLAVENREFEDAEYIRDVYFGVGTHKEEIDAMIARHAKGWKPERIAPVSRSIIRLCIYEMKYREDIPTNVALNEAIELTKQFDDPKARAFVNGVLNGVKEELEAGKQA